MGAGKGRGGRKTITQPAHTLSSCEVSCPRIGGRNETKCRTSGLLSFTRWRIAVWITFSSITQSAVDGMPERGERGHFVPRPSVGDSDCDRCCCCCCCCCCDWRPQPYLAHARIGIVHMQRNNYARHDVYRRRPRHLCTCYSDVLLYIMVARVSPCSVQLSSNRVETSALRLSRHSKVGDFDANLPFTLGLQQWQRSAQNTTPL